MGSDPTFQVSKEVPSYQDGIFFLIGEGRLVIHIPRYGSILMGRGACVKSTHVKVRGQPQMSSSPFYSSHLLFGTGSLKDLEL